MSNAVAIATIGLMIACTSTGFAVYFNKGRYAKHAKRWIAVWDILAKVFMVMRCAAVLASSIMKDPKTGLFNLAKEIGAYKVAPFVRECNRKANALQLAAGVYWLPLPIEGLLALNTLSYHKTGI